MSIRLAEANRAIQATLARAHNLALNVSVAVCDADGRLVALQRMDGTLAEAARAAIGKAVASAGSGRPSGEDSVQEDYSRIATVIDEGAPLIRRPGGLPIIRGGRIAGALGVAGAGNDGQDEECALAGIRALEEQGRTLEA